MALLDQDPHLVDTLKIGPWLDLEQMQWLAATYPILLHCHDGVVQPQLNAPQLAGWVEQTAPPWLSLHLGLPEHNPYLFWQRTGIRWPLVNQRKATIAALRNLEALHRVIHVPIALENQAHHRHSGHDYLVSPLFIKEIVEKGNTHLLLDLGHVRVSAAMRHETPESYLDQLPLEHVIEIHVSGPALYRGRLRDLHHPLTAVDYDLLRYTLTRCSQLKAVTLEYYGPVEILRDQLHQLRQFIPPSPSPSNHSEQVRLPSHR
ncbi:MAG: DUF692 family protein [Anaerolineales bacterium]|nr:DUF692 family protein [Anaerolineales bacterium]